MIRSQAIALRCAAALPCHLLGHRRQHPLQEAMRESHRPLMRIDSPVLRQLEACADDAARRILLGVSH